MSEPTRLGHLSCLPPPGQLLASFSSCGTHFRLSSGACWAAPLYWNLCTSDGKDRCPNTWAMETQGYWSSDLKVWDCSVADPTTPQEHWPPLWSHQGAECSLQPKHKDRGRAPLNCPLPELPPPPAGPCCWCCFCYGGRACLQSCCECRLCPFLMSPVSAGVCSLPAPHPLQSPLRSVPVVGSPSQLPSPGAPVATWGPRSAPQGLDTELPPSQHRVFTWAFVRPPGQSPPWRWNGLS